MVHALKLAPDKSSINTSSCSEDTAKEQSAAEETKEMKEEEVISKDETGDKGEDAKEAGKEGEDVKGEEEKEEAVNYCDENNLDADAEKVHLAGKYLDTYVCLQFNQENIN